MSGSNALFAAMPRQNYLMAADPVSELWANLPEYGGGNSVRAPALTNPGVNVRPVEYIAGQPVRPGYRNELIQLANLASGFAGTSINAVPVPGIRAFHGSPHRFDRFDMSRIGTGEGAQAYGHGLYFAGNEGVARGYRDALSQWRTNPDVLRLNSTLDDLHGTMMRETRLRDPQAMKPDAVALAAYRPQWDAAVTEIRGLPDMVKEGHMYEVNLRTSPDRLLDWDAPIASQPMEVRGIADTLRGLQERGGIRKPLERGADIWHGMRSPGAAREMGYTNWSSSGPAEHLRMMNVPGIQYLDAGSRAAGEGSRNYVMFDDKLIDIIRRYGIVPPALWGATQGGDGTQ